MTPVPFSISDIENALLVKSVTKFTSENLLFSGVSTDSRKVKQNELFVALKGESFDGEDFVTELFLNKIKGFIVHKGFFEQLPKNLQNNFNSQKNGALLFEIDNTITGIGRLAKFQRLRCKATIIAITGSNGKTTTRKITGGILERSFNTLTTKGNFNNEIGLPLTLLKLSMDHEWAVIEMGMNHAGEISRLANIALPDIGIITNTSAAHLEGLGNADNVAKAKAEMFQHMNNNSTAIINIDDPRFEIMESKAKESSAINKIICFGTSKDADIKPDVITENHESNGMTSFSLIQKNYETIDVIINSPAPFMVINATAAVAAAREAGADKNDIKRGLKAFTPVQGRMNFSKISNKINLIDDTYNANPDSVKQALITLSLVSRKNTSIAVLGDMLELGKEAANLHEETGKLAAQNNISKIYTYGKLAAHIIKGAIQAGFSEENTMNGTREEIAKKVMEETCTSTSSSILWVLVKGSRGMQMEKVIQKMQKLKCNNKETEKSI
ncbi:MAG: UDP-N-acetylmuramoyl-tripeptide--D-alanyl-D-alanine ligase [Desulfobacteraceae bacterium]|nr:UDP-N-acetylmuramoyl-tripeptide--D-alanyl-D-alanine ligase [Desulfobacteraceae bacterium]